jgi:hypothetical protein
MKLLEIPFSKLLPLHLPRSRKIHICLILIGIAMIPIFCKALLQQPNPPRNLPEFINRLPDENDQARMRQEQNGQADFEAASAYRHKQVSDESAKLVKLAIDLKAEVDKSGNDTLSVNALRKAEAIEKLAHNIKEKMTITPRSN